MPHFPAHTPYDGSSTPFTIGLKPLDPTAWIEVDSHLEAQLAEKDRLEAGHGATVFAAEPGSEDAQREVLTLIRLRQAELHLDKTDQA